MGRGLGRSPVGEPGKSDVTRTAGRHGSRDHNGQNQLATPSEEELGSNETIHLSVRVLTAPTSLERLEPMQGPGGIRAGGSLGERSPCLAEPRSRKSWTFLRTTPRSMNEACCIRWLDRDFAAREALGGKMASEAIAGGQLEASPPPSDGVRAIPQPGSIWASGYGLSDDRSSTRPCAWSPTCSPQQEWLSVHLEAVAGSLCSGISATAHPESARDLGG